MPRPIDQDDELTPKTGPRVQKIKLPVKQQQQLAKAKKTLIQKAGKPIFSKETMRPEDYHSLEDPKSGRQIGYFENRKLSIKEFDKRGRFGTVKNSVSSNIAPNNSGHRAVTVLDDDVSNGGASLETYGQTYEKNPSKQSSFIQNKTADDHHPPMHPRSHLLDPRNLKNKTDIKLLQQYQKQQRKAFQMLTNQKQKRRPTNSKARKQEPAVVEKIEKVRVIKKPSATFT